MRNLQLYVGDTKPLRWFFESSRTKRPVILTGHTITLDLNDGAETVTGILYEGDCGVYFDIPDAINSAVGTSTYRIMDQDDQGETITIETGTIDYR